jgi:hypothetical protein
MQTNFDKLKALEKNLTKLECLKLILSAVCGATLAILIAIIINIVLIEISFNVFFSAVS